MLNRLRSSRNRRKVGPNSNNNNNHSNMSPQMSVSRPIYNQVKFDDEFGLQLNGRDENNVFSKMQVKCSACSLRRVLFVLASFLPIIQWLPKYKFKKNLMSDVVAGVTVGIMNIPQGMAYGILAGLPPVYGLYTSLLPPFFYAIFGTSRHISVGTFAVVSLMVATSVDKVIQNSNALGDNLTSTTLFDNISTTSMMMSSTKSASLNRTTTSFPLQYHPQLDLTATLSGIAANDLVQARVAASATLTFTVGILMAICGFIRFGFIASYISDQLVQGLTTGAAVHVFSSQVPNVFGVSGLERDSGIFGLIKFYVSFFEKIGSANVVTLAFSATVLFVLIVNRQFISDPFRKKFKFPLPAELLVVIGATLASHYLQLTKDHGVLTVGAIPSGLPDPVLPDFSVLPSLMTDAITIAVVSFSLAVSMSKMFAQKHHYPLDGNQEWLAFGFSHVLSSFFNCHCFGASLSRSAVQDEQGGKSQIASFVAVLIILAVLLFLAPLFTDLPNCALAAIIIVALKSLLFQVTILPSVFRQSRIDCLIWVVSFSGVVLLGISYGLFLGIVFAILSVIYRTQWPEYRLLGRVKETNEYRILSLYSAVQEIPGVRIFRFEAPIYFANVELFKEKLYKAIGFNPFAKKLVAPSHVKMNARNGDLMMVVCTEAGLCSDSSGSGDDSGPRSANRIVSEPEIIDPMPNTVVETHSVIIDFSTAAYIDLMGVNIVKQVYNELTNNDISVMLVNSKYQVRHMFFVNGDFHKAVPKSAFFVSIHDAVLHIDSLTYATTMSPATSSETIELQVQHEPDHFFDDDPPPPPQHQQQEIGATDYITDAHSHVTTVQF